MLEIEALDVSRDPAPARQTSGLKAGVVRRPRAAVNTAHRSDATGGATDVHGRRLGGTRPCQALLRVTHRDRRTATPATALPARQHPVSTQTRDLLAAVNSLEAVLRQCRPKPDADGAQAFVKSSGDITVSVVPVLQGRVQPEHDPASRVARHALTGQGRSCDVAARFRQPSAPVRIAARGRVPCTVNTRFPARAPTAMRQVQAAACNGLSVSVPSESASALARQGAPSSSTSTPRQIGPRRGSAVSFSRQALIRFFNRLERTRVADGQTDGLEASTGVTSRIRLDAGPKRYRVELLGAILSLVL